MGDGVAVSTPAKMDEKAGTTDTDTEDADGVPGSWRWPGPALAMVAIGGLNQQKISLAFSLSLCLSNKINNF